MEHAYKLSAEHEYFYWLCELVHIDQDERTYWLLAKELFEKPFIPLIAHDENRSSDGLELREEYMSDADCYGELDIDGDCSIFEMLIALARRMDFETSDPNDPMDTNDTTAYWFWEMIDNLGLMEFDDDSYIELEGQTYVDWILEIFVDRQYEPNGEGGIFPLKRVCEDQREVELWYQMNNYLMENKVVCC